MAYVFVRSTDREAVLDAISVCCFSQCLDLAQPSLARGGLRSPDHAVERVPHRLDADEMQDVAGGHHRHPTGEIDLIMPLTGAPEFDGHGAGWLVYEPGTAHTPTVSGVKALVLYLLPQGAIEFTKA